MPTKASTQSTIELIHKYQIHFRKDLGQNFLIDDNILRKIVESAEVTNEDYVLEIGPGIGNLTRHLAEAANHVASVEIDPFLIPILKETMSPYTNVSIIHNNILKMDLNDFLMREAKDRPVKVVANLPYYITTPILMGLLEKKVPIQSITVMIQEEVARRIQSAPGTKEYGALSLAVAYYATPHIVMTVSPNCFIPRPKVSSSVLRLDCLTKPSVEVTDEDFFFSVIRAAFNQRRKTLCNALSKSAFIDIPKEKVVQALQKMELSETIRGEVLTIKEFAQLSQYLRDTLPLKRTSANA
ncbi:MAG: 16S rRNA (adenine(1518)-N(6)/adenine(1519)-N(6))-dimethyltransferase RsmA [Lachnospiraceae bacterium]|jgi:16S rRNA (adenine1518-N6/adenine1519-N6)-dimethyltransferase|nr:16S rRNA (adenine(1518)-N(6)/adenine(1519)-N(6))-dimethyltransferase RsmA [Lachnospiraceae bacterium]